MKEFLSRRRTGKLMHNTRGWRLATVRTVIKTYTKGDWEIIVLAVILRTVFDWEWRRRALTTIVRLILYRADMLKSSATAVT